MTTDDPIRREAAQWLARRDRGLSPAEQRELEAWLGCDPRNLREFEQISEAWEQMNDARASRELTRMAAEIASRHPPPARSRRQAPLSWLAFGIIPAAAAAIAVVLWFRAPSSAPGSRKESYQIVPASAQTLRLPDGSVVDVKLDGAVNPDYSPAVRRVVLARGEAHFAVAKNPARPFIVAVGSLAVRAVGTAFDVRKQPGEIDVLVTEGKVSVESSSGTARTTGVPVLSAGHEAKVMLDASGAPQLISVAAVMPGDIDRELAWRSTWFVFDRTPLGRAVEAFNQQGTTRLVLGDESLRGRPLGGTFRADNVDAFVRLIGESLDLKSERGPAGEIVLLPAR